MQTFIILLSIGFIAWMLIYKPLSRIAIFWAAIISLPWVALSGIYHYKQADTFLGMFSLFPLVAWIAGLTLLWLIYSKLPKKHAYVKACLIYFVMIVVLEYAGYNWWNIQLASNYPGLAGYPLMHMPWWGQTYYLAIGPVFLAKVRT